MILEAFQQYFIQCLINSFAVIYVIAILLERKINFKDYKLYITLALFVVCAITCFKYVGSLIRFPIMTVTVCIGNYYLFRRNLRETLTSSVFEQLLFFFVEILLTIVLVFIFHVDSSKIGGDFLGNLFFVVLISLSSVVMILVFPCIKKLYKLFLKITYKINIRRLSVYILIIIISMNFFYISNFLEIDFQKVFVINIIFVVIYMFILFYAMHKQNENIKFKEENKILINNLNEYEKMLDHQRISNHENKNQLLTIKGMLDTDNEKVSDYIDEIVKEKRADDEVLYTKTKRIPAGGLQGLVYQKMLIMKDKDIQINLNISKKLIGIDFTDEFKEINYDICRIVGVFLDNAIEEVIKAKKKEREILVSMYIDEYFIIEISNIFFGDIEINRLTEKGYTSKGKGRGYGLSLVDRIINKNDRLELETIVINNIFTQKLKIKM